VTSMLRVAVFNDSPTMRAAIRAAVEREPDMRVVTEQASGEDAAGVVARSQADAVIMDVIMPGVDGYQATREIMRRHPTPIVMVSSVVDARDAAVVFAALEAGALHLAEPPPSPGAPHYAIRCAAFAELLRTVASVRPTHIEPAEPGPRPAGPPLSADAQARPSVIGAIGIVSSAGGPKALGGLLRALPAGVMPPILLVQHLTAGFAASFASWLGSSTGHPVLIAEHGLRASPGCVYMPPEDHHIGLAADLRIQLDGAPPIAGFRPSGDHLLMSLARHGRRALAVVLSGMGRDGAEGAARLRQAGGHVVAQALESAAVTGMPSAASQSGAAEAMLAPEDIASWLMSRSGVS
jgi:two-component system chemotaxis response regulator CheB